MSRGLLAARGQIAFLVGLVAAAGIVLWLDRLECVPASDIAPATLLSPAPAEAEQAWRYVERNRNPRTGLVNSNNGAGWTTLGDTGHALRATLAAHRLGLIHGRELYEHVDAVLRTTATHRPGAAAGRLDVATGRAAGPDSVTPSVQPFLNALELIAWSYPANSSAAAAQLAHWNGAMTAGATGQAAVKSELERNADVLVRAAVSRKGEH